MVKQSKKQAPKSNISPARRKAIEEALERVIKEYGETLVLLGKE